MSNLNTPSSTLWATASKEWIIQPKPKPGRKPKKDTANTSKDDAEVDIKGRRIQNRAAQRAFRERKQSQLSELQARIQSYEQGEIERNVALQNIAKRLKEENEKLRKENIALQAELSEIQNRNMHNGSQNCSQADKKRWRDESPSNATSVQLPQRKKSRINADRAPPSIVNATHLPSPASMVSTPDSGDAQENQFPYDTQPDLSHPSFDMGFNRLPSETKADDDVLRSYPSLGCGFCDGGAICLCREISVHGVVDGNMDSTDFEDTQLLNNCAHDISNAPIAAMSVETSILDNLPAYQPPVPLRRRPAGSGIAINSIFPVTKVADTGSADASCSGDPSNCLACGDDAFGKAFCSAIVNTSSSICDGCPSQANMQSNLGCCGSESDHKTCPSTSQNIPSSGAPSRGISSDFISTNDAWKKLKAHPNVEFADLSLLAEVVASRSKCSGPRLTISPPSPPSQAVGQFLDVQLGQRRQGSPSLQLVPQEVLLECGRRRMRHVHADGVKEALRLLDAKFS